MLTSLEELEEELEVLERMDLGVGRRPDNKEI
jgi:hypothetical protein